MPHNIPGTLVFWRRQSLLDDLPFPWNLCSKWRTTLSNTTTVRAGEKRSISTNRKLTMRFPSSHRWPLCVNPKYPKGWLKTRIFTFGIAFHFFVSGNHRHFRFGMWVEHSISQPTDDKPCLKWMWSCHVSHFKFLVPSKISLEWLKLETSNLVCMLIIANPSLRTTNYSWKVCGHCHMTSLIFGK